MAWSAMTNRKPARDRWAPWGGGEVRSAAVAKNMRRLHAARGLSQEALAHECGINRTYLSGVERSERNVSLDNIARIAKGLGVEAWKLLKDD
jgi:transcriptional regulator with XRE-family HTH domain